MQLCIAYTGDISAAMEFHKEVEAEFGITDIMMDPLFKCIPPYWTGSISTCLCKKNYKI